MNGACIALMEVKPSPMLQLGHQPEQPKCKSSSVSPRFAQLTQSSLFRQCLQPGPARGTNLERVGFSSCSTGWE